MCAWRRPHKQRANVMSFSGRTWQTRKTETTPISDGNILSEPLSFSTLPSDPGTFCHIIVYQFEGVIFVIVNRNIIAEFY